MLTFAPGRKSERMRALHSIRSCEGSSSGMNFTDTSPLANSWGAVIMAEKNCCWKATQLSLAPMLLEALRPRPISAGFFSPSK